uniref:Transmembrane protein 127 transmembrane region domain-containing protein n=1 Tax=Strigamia maritima TaxID=126957 RepID=T1IIZ6_STRMM
MHTISRRRRSHNKEKERNLVSSVLSMLVIALISTAIAQPRWFYLHGGACPHSYLGVEQFFNFGSIKQSDSSYTNSVHHDLHSLELDFNNCVNPHIILMMRLVIAFSFLAIMSSLFAFVLDTLGVTHKTLKLLRRNAFGSMLTIFFCVTVIGLSYYITTLIEFQQQQNKERADSIVEVKFDVSFYLVAAAGWLAVMATAANLLRKPLTSPDDSRDGLLDEFDGIETFSVGYPSSVDVSPMHLMPPPPPPYTP